MSTRIFHPSRLRGIATVPPAKSEAHRALLLAALGRGECVLEGFAPPLCDDTEAMLSGVAALGARVTHDGDRLLVAPAPELTPAMVAARVSGQRGAVAQAPMVECDVRACAAALRMLIPVFLARGQAVRFTMDAALARRPLDALKPIVEAVSADMALTAPDAQGRATLSLSGFLSAGDYVIDGSQSSQFASGLLIALSHATDRTGAPAPSTLTVSKPIVSRPYLDMTLMLMERFHAPARERDEGVFALAPSRERSPQRLAVAGDWSQAAVLLCANAMGSAVTVANIARRDDETQGDARVLDALMAMGLRIVERSDGLTALTPSRDALSPLALDCSDIPDIAPILALACTQACGVSTLGGVGRLRIKECDRLEATVALLGQLGARVRSDGDTLTVSGPTRLRGGFEADARGDHRMAMLLAVAALVADAPITVAGVESLHKSWPGFLETYQALGGIVE